MSRDDLLADLQEEVATRPAAPPAPDPVVPTGTGPLTPALDVSLTPLRWSLPSVGPSARGVGLVVQGGPVKVQIALR